MEGMHGITLGDQRSEVRAPYREHKWGESNSMVDLSHLQKRLVRRDPLPAVLSTRRTVPGLMSAAAVAGSGDGWMAERVRKIEEQQQADAAAGPALIFRHAVLYFNGRTTMNEADTALSRQALTRSILARGGRVVLEYSAKVTHVIGVNTSARKAHQVLTKRKQTAHWVTPQWIVACVQANHRVPESQFSMFRDTTQPCVVQWAAPAPAAAPSASPIVISDEDEAEADDELECRVPSAKLPRT